MISEKKHTREPLIHVTKRDNISFVRAFLIRFAAIVAALAFCGLVIVLLVKQNPVQVYKAMFQASFGSSRRVWSALQNTAILLCISLAVTPAFKMRFWNTGAEGQVLMGAVACSACMIYLNGMDQSLLLPVMLAVSIAAGCLWAVIPAFFKAKWNTNETLFTLMMNYVAMQIVSFCITLWENPKGSNSVGIINSASQKGWLPSVFGQKYFINILFVAVIMVLLYVYLKQSKHGYEISVVGESENTARYIGINVKKVIIRTMALSGALCGIAGFLLVSGTDHSISTETVGGQGFTAIMVSWLAKFNPVVMFFTSFLIIFLQKGAGEIAKAFRINASVSDILTGIILFFIIGCEFFINYKLNFRHKKEG